MEKKVFLVYGSDGPVEQSYKSANIVISLIRWEETIKWKVCSTFKAAEHFVINNVTDIAENGCYHYMIIQPLVIDSLVPDIEDAIVYKWSKRTNKFYQIARICMCYSDANTEDGEWKEPDPPRGSHRGANPAIYLSKEIAQYTGDIADLLDF